MDQAQDIFVKLLIALIIPTLQVIWKYGIPWIMQKLSHEPQISGGWKTTIKFDQKTYNETVTLKQTGRRVWGNILFHESDQKDTSFKFDGTFKNLILKGTYVSNDPTNYEEGAFVLQYRKNSMVGKHILFSKETGDNILCTDYTWSHMKS